MAMELKTIKNPDGSFVRSFEANGRRYTIRTPQEGVGIYRHTKMMQMGAVLGMNATFATIYNNLKRAEECVDSLVTKTPRLRELGLVLNDMRRGVVEGSKERYSYAFQYCTFFVVWDDENLSQYDDEQQQSKIDDWNKEGLSENDFLSLGLTMVEGYIAAFLELSARMESARAVFSSDTVASTQTAG